MTEAEAYLRRAGDRRPVGIKLVQGTFIVGRDSTCDLVLSDTSVSRRHAEIVIDEHSLTVRDLTSKNGTFVDNERIESHVVQTGEQVRFGSVSFIVATNGLECGFSDSDAETQSVDDVSSTTGNDPGGLLTPAEFRVFELLLEGNAEKKIAQQLQVSRHTVHNHVRRIYEALRVHSRSELLVQYLPQRNDAAPQR